MDDATRELNCEKLRGFIQDCLGKHLYPSAAFYADKLVALTGGAPADVYLLAQAYFISRQPQRALQLLRHEGLLDADVGFTYLAGQCLLECKEYDECLAAIGDDDADFHPSPRSTPPAPAPSGPREIAMPACMCLLRGRAHEALANRVRAAQWYAAALRHDPCCVEAYDALIGGHMLTAESEADLLASLDWAPEDAWLQLMYTIRAKPPAAPEAAAAVDAQLDALDALLKPPPLAGVAPGRPAVRRESADVTASRAAVALERGHPDVAYRLTSSLLAGDPYSLPCLATHLAAAVEGGHKAALFLRAHQLVHAYPTKAISWYAVGCYYTASRSHDAARRHFAKATSLEGGALAPAWVAFGNAFALQDESDAAMAAYRTAARLFPGAPHPPLAMAVEHLRTGHVALAHQALNRARLVAPGDPRVHHELGVLAYRDRDWAAAEGHFRAALAQAPQPPSPAWEATVVNLGHALRKRGRVVDAVACYTHALGLVPRTPGTLAALGFCAHLQGDAPTAVGWYHAALAVRPDDGLVSDLLADALLSSNSSFPSE